MSGYRAIARFEAHGWTVRVEDEAGSLAGGTRASRLDLVEPKSREVVEARGVRPDSIALDVCLPAATEHRLELAEQLCDDATTEVNAASREMRELGLSVSDVLHVLRSRRLSIAPTPMAATNAELAANGLSHYPDAIGVRWDDHGYFTTVTCRACVDLHREDHRAAPPDEDNE